MFPEERRAQVARIIDETGRVTVSELARRFGVTEDLMRRDLKQLAEEGRCQKVYGGATRVENVRERPMSARIDQHAGEKLAIARKALPLVGPGQTVYLDMSSTCVQLARLIASSGVECTVVTPMVDVLVALAGAPGVTTLCCGGTMRADLSGLTGSIALDVVGRFRFDAAFMGAYGMDAETGEVSTFDADDGALKAAAMARASQAYLLCESAKFSAFGTYRFASLANFDALVCDAETGTGVDRVRSLGVDVL